MTEKVFKNYRPVCYKLPELSSNDDIFKSKVNPTFSKNIDYPKFSYGFHHYIHQNKDKMEITEQFKNKKKVFYVMNEFERNIDEYDEDIGGISKQYFNINQMPNILSRAFYKLWELLFMFDLVQLDKKDFVSAHLAEGPGSFIQATMFYRDKFTNKGLSKNDKYYGVTLHSEDLKKHVPPLEEKFVKYYSKEKPVRFIQHKTYPRKLARQSNKKDNGDLTDPKTIKLFGGNFDKKKADFVTADGGFDWVNENTQEQEAFKLILAQIVTALRIQAKGGNFVCKIFESFTQTTVKFMCILSKFYEEVYAVKPFMSRKSNSEKYLVCRNFKFGDNDKSKDKHIDILEGVLNNALKKEKIHLVDIFPDYKIPLEFEATITKLNTDIANNQLISINEMIDFINKQNFRGEEYRNRRQLQIEASKYWNSTFFPNNKEFDGIRKNIKKSTENLLELKEKGVTNLLKVLKQ
jgi:23S rRNA U2552 (ribose-2'-O)-methylase RlmE/FtsJ